VLSKDLPMIAKKAFDEFDFKKPRRLGNDAKEIEKIKEFFDENKLVDKSTETDVAANVFTNQETIYLLTVTKRMLSKIKEHEVQMKACDKKLEGQKTQTKAHEKKIKAQEATIKVLEEKVKEL
jgi:hypothetical protein